MDVKVVAISFCLVTLQAFSMDTHKNNSNPVRNFLRKTFAGIETPKTTERLVASKSSPEIAYTHSHLEELIAEKRFKIVDKLSELEEESGSHLSDKSRELASKLCAINNGFDDWFEENIS